MNPSGKLPFYDSAERERPALFPSDADAITYGFYHGYSLLDKTEKKAMYPFGFGLSYNSFSYHNATIARKNDQIEISADVENTGKMDGEEVVQVYVGMEKSHVERQRKLLKGFEKRMIQAGSSQTVPIGIPLDELRYYSVESSRWELEHGLYSFWIGPSSDENSLQKVLLA